MTNINLHVFSSDGRTLPINIGGTADLNEAVDLGDLHEALYRVVEGWERLLEGSGASITGAAVEDESGEALDICVGSGNPWIYEVAQLWTYLDGSGRYCPTGAALAYIDNVGWEFFDFDEFRRMEDDFAEEFDGSYSAHAADYIAEMGGIPDWLDDYIDYEMLGEGLVSDYARLSWGGKEYLFHQ